MTESEAHTAGGDDAASLLGMPRAAQEAFLRTIEAATTVHRRHQFHLWTQGLLHGLLPHSLMICALRRPDSSGLVVDRFGTVPVSDRRFRDLCASPEGLLPRMTRVWLESGGRPVLASVQQPSLHEALAIESHIQDGVALHGVFDPSGGIGSAFLFLGLDARESARDGRLLERLVPWLHAALVRVSTNAGDEAEGTCIDALLSARELEVLRCVQQGMGNTAIGGALGISPHTVKNHLQKVLRKLSAGNRAQAVARATRMRLIPPLSRLEG